jgi:hypothetical protein
MQNLSQCFLLSLRYPAAWREILNLLQIKDNHRKEKLLMSKVKEMAMTIEDLRAAAAAINDAADWLAAQFSGNDDEATAKTPAAPAPAPVEAKKPELKLEDVRAVLAEKSRAGFTAEVRSLLQKYGATKLSLVDPKDYEALLKDAEVLSHAT